MYRDTFASMHHMLRNGFWRQAQNMANQVIKSVGGEPCVFTLWYGYTCEMEGNLPGAAKEYKTAERCAEVRMVSYMAQLNVLRRGKMIDTEAVDDLESKMMVEENNCTPTAFVQLALYMRYTGEFTKARDYINKALAQADFADEYATAQSVRGWIDLSCGRAAFIDKSLVLFERAISTSGNDLDAMLGKIAFLEKKSQPNVIETLTHVIVAFPTLSFLQTLKAQVLLKMDDWDQGVDIAQRVLSQEPRNIEALTIMALYFLVKESKFGPATSMLTDLVSALDQQEPCNVRLYYTLAQAFARLSNNLQILTITTSMLERALKIAPNAAYIFTEMGYQSIFRSDYKTALTHFAKGAQSDEGATAPLLGTARCMIMLGKLDEAEKQLEFLHELQAVGKSGELLLLTAMVQWRKYRNGPKSIELLLEAMQAVQTHVSTLTPGIEMYSQFSPQLLIDIARELMQHVTSDSREANVSSRTDPIAESTHRCLELLVRIVPGSVQGLLLAAQIAFITGNYEKAHTSVVACLRQDNTCAEAHLLAAQIAFNQENYSTANSSLEQALCLDFEVREMPLYCYLKGTVLSALREFAEAIAMLQRAIDLMKALKQGKGKQAFLLTNAQQTSVYVELAQVHVRMKNIDEAHRIIHEASNEMRGTTEEGRITMVQAMITARKDVEMALSILRSIPSTSAYFLKAKAQMANLYLTQRSNRREFAKCYEELVEAYPSVSSYTFLGEAYLSIQEPERAVAALEKARSMDPNDAELAGKIGRALMITHDYQKALRYYRDAVSADPSRWMLRHDLAALYTRLADYEKAISVLREGLDNMKGNVQTEDISTSIDKVKSMIMLSKVYRRVNDLKAITECLVQARVFQNTVLNRMRGESSDTIYKQRSVAANICYDLGQTYTEQQQAEKALTLFNEALKFEETHDKSMLALAQLYLERGDLEGCEQQCNALLRVVPGSEAATIMLADIMQRKSKLDEAAFHFQSLLERKPNNYDALVRYVQLLRYCGKLQDASKFFANLDKTATVTSVKGKVDSGMHFARGLYYRYTNEPQNALKEFHQGRHPRDNPWAERCVVNMIEIYLNPDNENIWEDTGEQVGEQIAENVRTAEKLLHEVQDRHKKTILEAYILISTKKKENLDKALTKFYEIMSAEGGGNAAALDNLEDTVSKAPGAAKDATGTTAQQPATNERVNVACLVGMSTALQLLKQTPKARNHLKRVAKAPYYAEDGDHFERGWLMLADIYIEGGKFDLAQDLLKRALQANKSCGRAWEFMGLIYEKEQSYNDASECYECAWKLVNETDPGIGYKLAFNYLKARRFVNAIDVCTKVLTLHPKYPKIRKDILEKARSGLRP